MRRLGREENGQHECRAATMVSKNKHWPRLSADRQRDIHAKLYRNYGFMFLIHENDGSWSRKVKLYSMLSNLAYSGHMLNNLSSWFIQELFSITLVFRKYEIFLFFVAAMVPKNCDNTPSKSHCPRQITVKMVRYFRPNRHRAHSIIQSFHGIFWGSDSLCVFAKKDP